MIELKRDLLIFSFEEVHPDAKLGIEFQRTLRIPDDNKDYSLPPGLGSFPLELVDDYAKEVPPLWVDHGGIFFPMYQAEAMWINFHTFYIDERDTSYPFAIKIAAGKINAVTGESWTNELSQSPQDYLVSPEQPWLDGYCVEKGIIRQFVAMPLGAGYTAEEQQTGSGEYGGVQIVVYPMKREVFERKFPKHKLEMLEYSAKFRTLHAESTEPYGMGLAMGGRMRQEIYNDPYGIEDWDQKYRSRCFVHIANSMVWRSITGENPPTVPPTAKEYTNAGLPWFDYYSDGKALDGSEKLKNLKSVFKLGKKKKDVPLPENESVDPGNIVKIVGKIKKCQVREGKF